MSNTAPSAATSLPTLSRPTTATIMKMIHKLVPSSYTTKSKRKIQASDIQKLIDKVTRNQRKTVDIHKAFVKSLSEWGTQLPTHELRQTMGVFASLLDASSVSVLEECEHLASLKVSLGAVSQREERQRFLVARHDTLQAKLELTALKNGPQASQTMLCVDEIEENEYNLKLIEQQLARTATSNLRDAFVEFLQWIRSTNNELMKISDALARSVDVKAGTEPRAFERSGTASPDLKDFKDLKLSEAKGDMADFKPAQDLVVVKEQDKTVFKPTEAKEYKPETGQVGTSKSLAGLKLPDSIEFRDSYQEQYNQFHKHSQFHKLEQKPKSDYMSDKDKLDCVLGPQQEFRLDHKLKGNTFNVPETRSTEFRVHAKEAAAVTREDTLDSPIAGHVPILDMGSKEKMADYDIRNFERNIEGWGSHRF